MPDWNLKHFISLESTNTYVLKNLDGLNNNDIIIADVQTSGKGRFQREWVSNNPENIYMTIVLKPNGLAHDLPLANLTQYMSVILCRILKKYAIEPEIKWPNDVMVNKKKIAGILCETTFTGNALKGIALGVGINLNFTQDELNDINQPATSLNLLTNIDINKTQFLNELLEEFFNYYDLFLQKGFVLIKEEYISKCSFIGKEITIKNVKEKIIVKAQKINDDGSLQVLAGQNIQKTIFSGDLIY